MKVTVVAPANIAFIKHWGKTDEDLNLPVSGSISMNLSQASTRTEVEFDEKLSDDSLEINGVVVEGKEKDRVVKHLERIRKLAGIKTKARVVSENNIPRGAGIASSASAFAALSVAGSKAAGLDLSEKELSILARQGSGSACRSVADGFVEWVGGTTSETSYAKSIFGPDYWEIRDLIAVVDTGMKKVSSTEGHASAWTSPFMKARVAGMEKKMAELKAAMTKKDFTKFGEITEAEAINMHVVMMTSVPAIYYWAPATVRVMQEIIGWREAGLESYFTMDAGANVHVICEAKNEKILNEKLLGVEGVLKVLVNKPAVGARIV